MVIFLAILIFFGAITALTHGYNATGSVGIVLGVILGINYLIKYLHANRKCSICGERGGLYKMSGDVSYGDTTYCKYCDEIENEMKETRNADLRIQAEKDREEEEEEEEKERSLLSKTCPHCGKYNKDWDEIRRIYQSATINGALYQKFIYTRKCIYCSHNDDKISDWI